MQCRKHEQIHVRQYERWGPFFVVFYFLSSAVAWVFGKDPFWDNVFEQEAVRVSGSEIPGLRLTCSNSKDFLF